jgi:hypothetical protein
VELLAGSSFRLVLFPPSHKQMQGQWDFVGMRCAPGDEALELDGIVRDGTDFNQLGFDNLRISHSTSSMAHAAAVDASWLQATVF